MMRDLGTPRRPVVRRVVPPEVELVADPLLAEERREASRAVERAGRVLPLPLPRDQEQVDVAAEPVEMVAAEVVDVIARVVEVDGVAALAAGDDRNVVDAALADR